MSVKPNELRIGAFLLSGILLVLAGVLAFGARAWFQPKIDFETYVDGDAEGLAVGSAVKLRGVVVGRVTSIGFSWKEYPGTKKAYVVVRYQIRRDVSPLPDRESIESTVLANVQRGLRARVKGEGITGTSVLSIEVVDPASAPALPYDWTPKSLVIPSAPTQFTQILASLEKTVKHLEKVDFEKLTESLDRTLASADATFRRFGELDAKALGRSVEATAADAGTAVREVRELVADARSSLASMKLDAVGRDADKLFVDLQATNGKLQRLVDRVSGVDVRELNVAIGDVRRAASALDDVLEDLKRHPAGFLFGKAPPSPRGVDGQPEKRP